MSRFITPALSLLAVCALALLISTQLVEGQRPPAPPAPKDTVGEAQAPPRGAAAPRPQDQPDRFDPAKAEPSSSALETQPEKGQIQGFEFYRDPLNARKPMQTFEEIMKADVADKPKVMAAQQQLLERRYNLTPKLDTSVTMTRGKPLPVGPTARLGSGVTWESLAGASGGEPIWPFLCPSW